MTEAEFKKRTLLFGLGVLELVGEIPRTVVGLALARQLAKCGPSVGANYRAACRAKSKVDMAAKLSIVEEEIDECLYWFDVLIEGEIIPKERVADLNREGNEILSTAVSSIRKLKDR